jgi:hypothetical protein
MTRQTVQISEGLDLPDTPTSNAVARDARRRLTQKLGQPGSETKNLPATASSAPKDVQAGNTSSKGARVAARQRVLSAREQRVLDVVADPGSYALTVDEKCKLAGVGLSFWYKTTRDPFFCARLRELLDARILEAFPVALSAMVETARQPGKDGYGDRVTLSKMSGFLKTGAAAIDAEKQREQLESVERRLTDALARQEALLKKRAADDDDGPRGPVIDVTPVKPEQE